MSPLKTTSSAFSCSTFMASSSWQASASWASYGQEKPTEVSGRQAASSGPGTVGRAGGAALTSWSSLTRSCSCSRTAYSSSHLQTVKGEHLGAGPSPLRPPPPTYLAQARPWVGFPHRRDMWLQAPGQRPAPSCLPGTFGLTPNCGCAVPSQGPSRSSPRPDRLSRRPRPLLLPAPPSPVSHLRSTDPGSRSPACTRTELPCLPWDH